LSNLHANIENAVTCCFSVAGPGMADKRVLQSATVSYAKITQRLAAEADVEK